MIENCNKNQFSCDIVLLFDLVPDTNNTLDSIYLLDQLQSSIKAVKFYCGDNDIQNNVTLQVFMPICQVC